MSSTNPSETRMETLNRVFTGYFGQHWPYVLLGYAILLIIILVQLFFFGVQWNVSDKHTATLQTSAFVLWIFLSVVILLLGGISIRAYIQNNQNTQIFGGDFKCQTDYKQLSMMFALILGILFILTLISWWWLRSTKK